MTTIFTIARDITARATSQTVHLSWKPELEGIYWRVRICSQSLFRYCGERDRSASIGPDSPYEATFDDLIPDTLYQVEIAESWGLVSHAGDDIRQN